VGRGKVVLLAPDLRWLGRFEQPDKETVLAAHFQALASLIDLEQGTLVVSTPSSSLCNSDRPFDPRTTPGELGMLTEYIRTKPGAVRSFHPFTSYTALGAQAERLCGRVARHAFGPETPVARMCELDTLCVSVGLHPRFTCSEVHHAEMLMGVPYRYTKEFIHPVVRGGQVVNEPFYMYVWYRQCQITRNKNARIFERFYARGNQVAEASLGRGQVFSYPMAQLVASAVDLLRDDIYAWLHEPPAQRPYRQ
jgi:aminoglycoside 3-N-acetyltransferase